MLFAFHVALGGTQPKRLVEAVIFAGIATWVVDWVFEGAALRAVPARPPGAADLIEMTLDPAVVLQA